jgi:hypothetical protein
VLRRLAECLMAAEPAEWRQARGFPRKGVSRRVALLQTTAGRAISGRYQDESVRTKYRSQSARQPNPGATTRPILGIVRWVRREALEGVVVRHAFLCFLVILASGSNELKNVEGAVHFIICHGLIA